MNYNIFEAKTNFSKLIDKVNSGEKVVIAKSGKPVAELIPFRDGRVKKRIPGLARGQVIINDDFVELPNEIIEGFYR